MEIKTIVHQNTKVKSSKLSQTIRQFNELLIDLNQKQLPYETIETINRHIEVVNASQLAGRTSKRLLVKKRKQIIDLLQKEHKLFPKNYYRNLWTVLGISFFGLPIAIAFGYSTGNLGLIATGLPFGMAIGFALGLNMDKKVLKEGRQLNFELKNEI